MQLKKLSYSGEIWMAMADLKFLSVIVFPKCFHLRNGFCFTHSIIISQCCNKTKDALLKIHLYNSEDLDQDEKLKQQFLFSPIKVLHDNISIKISR